jgi:DNA-binding transcriptional LysR family regulator
MEQLDKIPDMVRTKAKLTSNTIHLNVLAASTFISEAIVEYKKEHEQIHFQFLQNNQEDLYDILVSTGLPNQHNEHIDSATYIRDEKILLAVPNNERFTGRKSISLSEVIDENFISLSNSSQYRLICNKLCSDIGFKPHITFDSDSLLAVMNMIAENMGIGFWPEFTWGNLKSDRILLLEIEDGNFTRNIIISHKLNKTDNKNVIEFFEFLKNYCENQ